MTALSIIFGHLETVKGLLESIRLKDPADKWTSKAERIAAIATANLEQQAVDIEACNSVCIVIPKELRCLQAIDRNYGVLEKSIWDPLHCCIEMNEVELFEILLKEKEEKKSWGDKVNKDWLQDLWLQDLWLQDLKYYLGRALMLGRTEIIEIILRMSPELEINPLRTCVKYGHIDSFKLLLKYITPSYSILDEIIDAKNVRMLEILAEDGRVDFSARDNSQLLKCIQLGNYPLINALLKDPRVDPATQNNRPLILSIQTCESNSSPQTIIVGLLLRTGRVILGPCGANPDPLILARKKGVPNVILTLEAVYKNAGLPI